MNTASVLLVLCVSWSLGGAARTTGFGSENDPLSNLVLKDPRAYTCKCGEKYESRIVGGTVTGKNEYPWMAAICYGATCNFQNQFCGGSLINDQYILTAAHCVEDLNADDISISLGDHNLAVSGEADSEVYTASEIIVHGNYNTNTLANDIALIKLSTKVTMSATIHPVCLPPARPLFTNRLVYTTGWGLTTDNGSASKVLREVRVKVLTNKVCNNRYGAGSIRATMLCATAPGKDSCQGDSGGPLVLGNANQVYSQIGIVSWGYECASSKYPGVYTRVNKYLRWIRNRTKDATSCPRS